MSSVRDVEAAYRRDPTRVIRSPSDTWHQEAWHKSKGNEVYGEDAEAPDAFTDGRYFFVAPTYKGPASTLPSYSGVEEASGGAGADGGAHATTATPEPAGGDRQGAPPNRLRWAVAPETPFSGPRGSEKAQPATWSEVDAARAADPNSVVRSPNDRWHRQGYRIDGGGREAPGAYRVGKLYVIAPDYPMKGVPSLGSGPVAGPAGSAKQPGPGADLGTVLNTEAAPDEPGPSKAGVPVRNAPAPAPTRPPQESGIPSPESQAPDYEELQVEEGGALGSRSTSAAGNQRRTSERKVAASPLGVLKTKPSIAGYSSERRTETVVGHTDEGTDIKKSNASQAKVNLGPKGVEGTRDVSHTTAGGTKLAAGGSVSMDWSGNMSAVGSLTIESQHGLSFSPTVGHSDEAEASDPQYVEGVGFLVTFKRSSTNSIGAGGGTSVGGGTKIGVNVGKSEAEFESGSQIFKTLDEATDFRDNVRKRTARNPFLPPPTSVAGALAIPEGESRGGGTSKATTIGGSLSYAEGLGDIGYSHVSTSTEEVSVMKVGPTTVDVTRTFSEDTDKDPHIGGLGFSNTKGRSDETGRAVTYRFDLASENGKAAFARWCGDPRPPGDGATDRRVKTFKSANEHDKYGFPVKFSAVWKGRTWESRDEDERGVVTETFGGAGDRDTRTGWFAENITRDKEQHANAQIVSTLKNGQESYAARFTVSGKSGDSNLEELGKMFSGARHDADESSGYWLVTAQINPAVVRDLERNSRAFRNAKTIEDKMRIYSDFEAEHGAQMIRGQVGAGGDAQAWNLELPGDPNFPGASGRAQLEDKHKAQHEQLATKHDSAASVANDAKQTIASLEARKAAVADTKRYTDLPDQLRKEQVDLIDHHIAEFAAVRSQSESLAMRNDPNEDIEQIRKRARSPKGYEHVPPDQLERRKLSDAVAIKEADIAGLSKQVEVANAVLQRMMPKDVRFGDGVKGSVWAKYNTEAKDARAIAVSMEPKLKASAQKARELRNQWSNAKDDASRLTAMRTLDAELKDQSTMVGLELDQIREATRAAYVVTSDYGIGRDWDYFRAIKCDANLRGLAINTASGQVAEDEL